MRPQVSKRLDFGSLCLLVCQAGGWSSLTLTGVRVSSLDPNGAAAHAGLAINDVIVSVDDFNVEASAPEEVINVILRAGHHVWSVTRLATSDSLAAEADHCAWCGHWSSG